MTQTDLPTQPAAQPAPPPTPPTEDAAVGPTIEQVMSAEPPEQPPVEQTASEIAKVERDARIVPFQPRDTAEMFRYAGFLARSNLIPKALHGRPSDVLVVLLKGQDLGLTPMQSISGINVIDGKAEVGAVMMVAMIMKSGLCEFWEPVFEESDATKATYITKRRGGRREMKFVYTVEDARAAGLLDKGKDAYAKARNPWNTQRPTMLRRRCQSNLGREVYADIVAGLYDHGELQEIRELERDLIEAQMEATRAGFRAATPDAEPAWMAPVVMSPGGVIVPEPPPAAKPADPLKARLSKRQAAPLTDPACRSCGVPIESGSQCEACRAS